MSEWISIETFMERAALSRATAYRYAAPGGPVRRQTGETLMVHAGDVAKVAAYRRRGALHRIADPVALAVDVRTMLCPPGPSAVTASAERRIAMLPANVRLVFGLTALRAAALPASKVSCRWCYSSAMAAGPQDPRPTARQAEMWAALFGTDPCQRDKDRWAEKAAADRKEAARLAADGERKRAAAARKDAERQAAEGRAMVAEGQRLLASATGGLPVAERLKVHDQDSGRFSGQMRARLDQQIAAAARSGDTQRGAVLRAMKRAL